MLHAPRFERKNAREKHRSVSQEPSTLIRSFPVRTDPDTAHRSRTLPQGAVHNADLPPRSTETCSQCGGSANPSAHTSRRTRKGRRISSGALCPTCHRCHVKLDALSSWPRHCHVHLEHCVVHVSFTKIMQWHFACIVRLSAVEHRATVPNQPL